MDEQPTPKPLDLVSDEYRTLIETASFDWLVATYIYESDKVHEHSSREIKASAIRQHGVAKYGTAFDVAVEGYRQ